jgi:fatty acid desaturase
MKLLNIETGPWGGLVLVVFVALAIAAIYFTTWIVSGILLVLLVLVPVALVVYFGGRRLAHRLMHGRGAT